MDAYQVRLPHDNAGRLPDSEYILLTLAGIERPVRLHDYATLYATPGLYEAVTRDLLACCSPAVLAAMLATAVHTAGEELAGLTVLDLGAGNGLGGAALARHGIHRLIGVDIVPEAAQAARRDQPGLYQDYLVADLTAADGEAARALAAAGPTCLFCLSAMGLGHVPPAAFDAAYRLLPPGGWVAFNLKEDFLHHDAEGFARLIAEALADGSLVEHARQRYVHRRHVDGRDLFNIAMIGRKQLLLDTASP